MRCASSARSSGGTPCRKPWRTATPSPPDAASSFEDHADEQFCYLTTTGRVTGRPHTIEIWFAVHEGAAYLLAGGGRRADWVRNLIANDTVELRIGERTWPCRAFLVPEEKDDGVSRRLLAAKYQGWAEGKPLSGWASSALLVGVVPATNGNSGDVTVI